MKNEILDTAIKLNFNPFGGLQNQEVQQAIVLDADFKVVFDLIDAKQTRIIQLVGKKGRGKTLHLKCLSQFFDQYPIHFLNQSSDFNQIIEEEAPVVFIDSIHHLSLFQRISLYQSKKVVILTTHFSRAWEYKLAGKTHVSFHFKGIEKEKLLNIIKNRIQIAADQPTIHCRINELKVEELIKKYNDDYRAILNDLYDVFQPAK